MNNAKLYSEHNGIQISAASVTLSEFKDELKEYAVPGARILDVGCGDGSVTIEILRKYISNNRVKIFGVDVNKKMTDFASMKYSASTGVEFFVMDIAKPVEKEWIEAFDLIVSFFCLHWVQDQRMAYSNIYEMLKNGGACLVVCPVRNPFSSIHKIMMNNPSWSKMLKDVYNDYIPYLSKFDNSEDEIRKILEDSKLSIKYLEIRNEFHSYDGLHQLRDFFMAINPYIGGMSPEKVGDYVNDAMEVAFTLHNIQVVRDKSGEITNISFPYELLVAYFVK